MTHETLLVDLSQPGLAVVTLNRPAKLNALSHDMLLALDEAINELQNDGNVQVIILTGAGRAFCAGLDLQELGGDPAALARVSTLSPAASIRRFNGVVIGAINGAAVTGGFELALACDILIGGESARFADTHVRVGVMPTLELSQRLSRTVGLYRAKYMSLTGAFVSALQAAGWGLLSQVVPDDQLQAAARAIADQLLSLPASELRAHKRLIDDGYALSLEGGLALEARRSAEYNAKVTPAAIAARRGGLPRPK